MARQGYMLIALGVQYIDECVFLINTLRHQGDKRPMSLIIFEKDKAYCESLGLFDQCILFDPSILTHDSIWSKCTTSFEKYCLFPRLFLNTYLVYDETIVIDSDVLCQSNPDPVWTRMSLSSNPPIVTIGNKNNPDWHWGYIGHISKIMGKTVSETHGGFFYLRRGDPMLDVFFKTCIDVFFNYEQLGCQLKFRGGKTDEVIFAIANAKHNIDPIEFSEFPIMTFNYTPDMRIPSKIQTERGLNIEMNDYIPFVHMFDKMGGDHFQNLYRRIIQSQAPQNKTIWLLWLQGWGEQVPYLIRRVSESWIHNNPDYKVNHISMANLKDYLDGPELEYMSKVTTHQALSDIIRLSLLAKYGGVWADATMLCMQPLSAWAEEKLAPSQIWMYHGQGGKMHPLCGPSSWFILVAHANHEIITKWKQACDTFWTARCMTQQLEYFWMDGLFKSLYHSDMSFKRLWDKVPFVDCDKPVQAHYLAFNNDMITSSAQIKANLETNPPFALKLSRFWDATYPDSTSEQAKQSNGYYAMELAMKSTSISKCPNQLAVQYVVAKYKEDVSWTQTLTNVIIYDKDVATSATTGTTTSTTIRLNNVGREAHTFIHHILTNWDHLAAVTVFLQGHPIDHIEGYGTIERFLQHIIPDAYTIGLSQNWHIDTFNAPRHAPGVDIEPKNNDIATFFQKHLKKPFHERIKWYCAAQFAVRSDIIKKVPKNKWIELKKSLEFSSNPITAHFLERLWYELLSGSAGFVETVAEAPRRHIL